MKIINISTNEYMNNNVLEKEITKPVIVMEMIIVGRRGLILSAHKPSQLELL